MSLRTKPTRLLIAAGALTLCALAIVPGHEAVAQVPQSPQDPAMLYPVGLVPARAIRSFAFVVTPSPVSPTTNALLASVPGTNGFILTDVVLWEEAPSNVFIETSLQQQGSDVAHFLSTGGAGDSPKPASYHFASGILLQPGQPLSLRTNSQGYPGNRIYLTLSGYVF